MEIHADSGLAPQVVVRVGAVRIGIPTDCVVRALSAPDEYAPLPRRYGGLLGMLAVDGQPVPVIDLACWVAMAGANPATVTAVTAAATGQAGAGGVLLRRVLLLRDGQRSAALQVDALEPLAALPASAVVRLCHDDDPEQLFQHAAILPDSGAMLALLNVANLFNLARSWCASVGVDAGAALAEDTPADSASDTETWAVVEACGERLALRAGHLAEVTTMPEMESFFGGSGVALCQWRGGYLAVLPLARLLGRDAGGIGIGGDAGAGAGAGGGTGAAAPLLAVLRMGDHSLGLPIQQVCDLRQLPSTVDGVRGDAPGRLPCLTISGDDGATLRMIDTEALFAMHPEAALNADMRTGAVNNARLNEETYVVLDAGGKLALPIAAFEEVLHAAPEDCVAAPAGGADATLNWRGATIQLYDLRQPVGAAARRGKVPLVVLRNGGAPPVALAVDQVVSMITPGSAALTHMRRAGETVELLILEEEGGSSTYRIASPDALLRRRLAA